MARSSLLSIVLTALAVSAAAALVSGEAAAQRVTMSVVSGSPPAHIISDGGVKPWMTCVSKAMGDNIQFNYFPAGQLIALRELQAGLESGVADSVPIPVGYVSEKLPLTACRRFPASGARPKRSSAPIPRRSAATSIWHRSSPRSTRCRSGRWPSRPTRSSPWASRCARWPTSGATSCARQAAP